ncbi:MAG: ATP-binding protein, partial [Planctomycetales bacterium]|nr:ATP-binding protein [Planctomycetales bacterium]
LVHSSAEKPEVEIAAEFREEQFDGRYRVNARFPSLGQEVEWLTAEFIGRGERRGLWGDPRFTAPCVLFEPRFQAYKNSASHLDRLDIGVARNLHQALANSWYLRWSARNLALPTALNAQRRFRIESNGFGLPTLIDDLLNYDRHRFGDLEREFIELFPDVRSIALVQQPGYDSPVDQPDETLPLKPSPGKQIVFRLRQSNYDLPASQAAEGMLYVLGYLALLYLPDPPRVLLIEEPENGIHPHRVADIVRLLRRLIERHPSTQVVLTSHSPYLVDAFEPHEVTWCHRDPEDNRVRLTRLDTLPEVQRSLSVFSLGEIWTGELETPPAAAESR